MDGKKAQQLTTGVAAGARDAGSYAHRMSMRYAAKSCQLAIPRGIRDESVDTPPTKAY